jgi:hypothetical protein
MGDLIRRVRISHRCVREPDEENFTGSRLEDKACGGFGLQERKM